MSTVTTYTRPDRLQGLAPSQIRENMRIARQVGAINMAQGRPDFPTDDRIMMAAIQAIANQHNQYSVTWGLEPLRQALSSMLNERYGCSFDPETQITVTCGVTEAMVAALLALVNPGDEVVIVEPAHENYVPAVRFAGGTPRFVTLRPPHFGLPLDQLESTLSARTRVMILNTPHNPTGRVFDGQEIRAVVELCSRHGCFVLTDEIYDRLLYPPATHVMPAAVAPDPDLIISTGGLSKIYAATGWRLGYIVASPAVTESIRTVHDYLTICAPTPFQHAAVAALGLPESYYTTLVDAFRERRDRLMGHLQDSGFTPYEPAGAYYVLADFGAWGFAGDADAFTRMLIEKVGVATVAATAFYYGERSLGERMVRFAFAKTARTINDAGQRLARGFAERPAAAAS